MNRRIFAPMLAIMLCLLAIGCGGETTAGSSTKSAHSADAAVSTNATEGSLTASETLDGLSCGQTEDEIRVLLGEPLSCSEPEYWGADGLMHTCWTYDGVAMSFAEGSVERVSVTAPFTGETTKGVFLGAGAEAVRAAYGDLIDGEMSTENRLVAGSEYDGLIFTLENGVVTQIILGALAE